MSKKKGLFFLVFLFIAAGIYFYLFHKNTSLKYIPKNADIVVLLDVKKFKRQYISSLITHPSEWFNYENKKHTPQNPGIKIPDFLQIFHLKNTPLSSWFSVLEIENESKFLEFLKEKKFQNKGKNKFQNKRFFVQIKDEKCIIGTSDLFFNIVEKNVFFFPEKDAYNAKDFINGSLGSISYISGNNMKHFSIALKNNEIEIKNTAKTEFFESLILGLNKRKHFLEAEFNDESIKESLAFFNKKNIEDSLYLNYFKARIDLESVKDTIISYEYDDNFNEIEKISYQKITQPNYVFEFQSSEPEKTWLYFENKKWINNQNQFTIIPFQPNYINKENKEIKIKSTRSPINTTNDINKNYFILRNNPLLPSLLVGFSKDEKKILTNVDYIFGGKNEKEFYLKIKTRENKLPLILQL